MTASLILVRHAAPKIDSAVSSTLWTLSDEGRAAAARLAEPLAAFAPAAVVSSPEPKAVETSNILAEHLNLTPTCDEGFVEHRRPGLGFVQRFEDAIRRIFEHPSERLFGGETATEACQRFEDALARHGARPLVVVTHGTVLSLFVGRKAGLDPFALWSSLKLPEAFILDSRMQLTARI